MRENPKQVKDGVRGSHAQGALGFCHRKRRLAREGQKQENTTPTSCHVASLPACAPPQPHQLVTKEKHAATLMQLGKCCFTNTARSSGLTL